MQDGKELVFGANVSQTRAIEELQTPSQPEPFQRMADHLLRIAGQLFCLSALLISFSVLLISFSVFLHCCRLHAPFISLDTGVSAMFMGILLCLFYVPIHTPTHPPTHSPTHPVALSLAHSLTPSRAHSLAHSPTPQPTHQPTLQPTPSRPHSQSPRSLARLLTNNAPHTYLCNHSSSLCITGTHVRSAATLGGNIALGKLRDLESDVITVFMSAGASVQVVCKTDSR